MVIHDHINNHTEKQQHFEHPLSSHKTVTALPKGKGVPQEMFTWTFLTPQISCPKFLTMIMNDSVRGGGILLPSILHLATF